MRQCVCIECGQPDLITYAEIRSKNSRYCAWCSCRQMYEQGLVSEPSKWDIAVEQAVQIILGNDFLARRPEGEVLDVVGLTREMEHM